MGLVSGQKAIFMNCQKQYQETDHMSEAEGAQFMRELSKLVIWQGGCSRLRVRFHTTGGAFCNPHPQQAEKTPHQTKIFTGQTWRENVLVEGGGWVCVVALGCHGGHTHSWGKERGRHTYILSSGRQAGEGE